MLKVGSRLGLVLALSLSALSLNCGDDQESCTGSERCACAANATCNDGLRCVSNSCVAPDSVSNGGGGNASNGGGGNASNGGGSAGVAGTRPGTEDGGAPPTSNGGASATAGGGVAAGGDAQGGSGGAEQECRSFETYPDGTVPTVFVLVDRSGSMFHCLSLSGVNNCDDPEDTAWAALKAGTLDMIEALDGSVRFGFGAFAGERDGTCPDFDSVPARLGNYDAIADLYDSITPPTKGETPTAEIVSQVHDILSADPSPGRKYVLFVTDGEPDFCDDSDALCAVDASVGALQALHEADVTTLVFGVDSRLSTISESTLQAFANAGAGQPVLRPTLWAPDVKTQCYANIGWQAAFAASGATGTSLGSYSTDGSAKVFRPDPGDQQALRELLASTVAGIKSCVFDLAAGLRVDLTKLSSARVAIEGVDVPRDDDDGWRMNDATQLELVGDACRAWREPGQLDIDFDFPCGTVNDD